MRKATRRLLLLWVCLTLGGCVCIRADEVELVACEPSGACPAERRCCADLLCHLSCEGDAVDGGQGDAGSSDAGANDGGVPVLLTIVSTSVTAAAGQCAPSPIRLELRDAAGGRATAGPAPLAIALSSNPSGLAFFADAACSTSLSATLSLPAGAAGASLYFRSTIARPAPSGVDVTFFAAALPSPGNTVRQVQFIEPGPAVRLVWLPFDGTTPVSQQAGPNECAPAFVLGLQDSFDNPARLGAATPVQLASTPSGVTFSPSAACSGGPVDFPADVTQIPVFARALSEQSYLLSATVGGLASEPPPAQLTVAPVASPATQLAFLGTVAPVAAGTCQLLRLETRNQQGSRTAVSAATPITLSTTEGAAQYFSGSDCTGTPTAALSLPAGAAEVTFAALLTGAPTTTVQASAFSASSIASQSWPVTAGVGSVLAWRPSGTPAASVNRFSCLANLAVDVKDAYGNPALAPATPSTRLLAPASSTAQAGALFFSSADCSGAPVSTLSLAASAAGAPAFSLAFTGTGPTTVTVSDSTAGGLAPTPGVTTTVSGTGTLVVSAPTPAIEVFDCEPIVVGRTAAAGDWTRGDTSLTVSLPPGATELKLHTASTCPGAGATSVSASIADGSATATVYVRGLSGAPTDVAVTASDAAGAFSDDAVTVTAVPLVRRGSCVLAASTTSASCAISPPLAASDLSHTFMVYQATGPQTGAGAAAVACSLASTSSIDCTRWVAGTSAMAVTWQTASWGRSVPGVGGVRVQHLQGLATGWVAAVDITGFTPVTTLANTFLLFGDTVEGVTLSSNDWPNAYLADAATLRIVNTGGYSLRLSYAAQIVEMEGAAVDRAEYTGTAADAGFTLTGLPAVTVGRTALLFGSRPDNLNDDAAICKRGWRGQVTAADTLSFTRAAFSTVAACTNNSSLETSWQRVQFPVGTSVQSCDALIGGGISVAAAGSCSLTASTVPHRTLVWLAGQGPGGQAEGETAHSTTDDIGHVNAGVVLEATGKAVTVTRGSASATGSIFTPMVIEFTFP